MKSDLQNDFPPFRSSNMWNTVLKELEKAIYKGMPKTIIKTRIPPLFRPPLPSPVITPFKDFFVVREDDFDCAFTWTKYKIKGLRNFIYILDTNGERHFLGNGSWSNNLLLRCDEHNIKIFTDTPWNDDFLIFKTSLPSKLYDCLVNIYETRIGVVISIRYKNKKELWDEKYYKINFKNQSLELLYIMLNTLTHSIVSSIGICGKCSNGDSIYAFNSEDYEFLSRHHALSTTGSVDIGIIESETESSKEKYLFYDLNLKKELWSLSHSYYTEDFSKYFSFGFSYPFLMDLLVITATKVYDLATGRVLLDTCALKKSKKENGNLISSVVRKSNGTGYYIQLEPGNASLPI